MNTFVKIGNYRFNVTNIESYYPTEVNVSNGCNGWYIRIMVGSDNSRYIRYDSEKERNDAMLSLDNFFEVKSLIS